VPSRAPGPGNWLARAEGAFKAGLEAGAHGSRARAPFRHPGLRDFWLGGYDLGRNPEAEMKRLRLAGEMPHAALHVLPEGDRARRAFLLGASSPAGECPYGDPVLREWWLGGRDLALHPRKALDHLRRELEAAGAQAEEAVARFRREIEQLGVRFEDGTGSENGREHREDLE
jgi:ribosome modulation factor